MRLLCLTLGAVILLGCGTPCTRVAGAEAGADDRGAGCNAGRNAWSASKLDQCERNLPDCSKTDLEQFEKYARCLDSLPRCADGQRTSWEVSRAACGLENLAFKVSLACIRNL